MSTGGSPGNDASMMYSKRAAEKRDMQNLNQRLAYYMGINRRQTEDYQKMKESLANARAEFTGRMQVKQTEITSTQTQFTSERNALTSELGNATTTASNALSEANGLQSNYAALTTTYVAKDGEVQRDEAALGATCATLKATAADLSRARRDLSSRENQSASLKVKLNEVNRDIDGLTAVTSSLETQLAQTRSTFASQKNERESKMADLGNAITQRKQAQTALEAELREEFQNKLKAFVGGKFTQYEQERSEWLKIFRDEYNKKIQAYKNQNRVLGTAIRDLHTNKQGLLGDILSRKSTVAQLTEERRQVEANIDNLRDQYSQTNKTIRDLKATVARKHQEFDELLAARINLENEIAKYKKMLDGADGK